MDEIIVCINAHCMYEYTGAHNCNKNIGAPKYNIHIIPFNDTITIIVTSTLTIIVTKFS
jgi:hypothetical protein